jgi:adenylate cyclase
MAEHQPEVHWPALQRASRTVVVVDVVESVRLMEQDEEDTIRRWQAFVREVTTRLLPSHGGRLVKSLGDGLLLEFESVPPAVQCTLSMQQAIQSFNQQRPAEQWMCLRIGAHVADVVVDQHDIFGSGVNQAARLAQVAGPGEVLVSPAVADGLIVGLDAELEDVGPLFLKHMSEPIPAYRLRAPAPRLVLPQRERKGDPLVPTLAVIPFEVLGGSPAEGVAGELIADRVIAQLSGSSGMRVISRLSTSLVRGRARGAADLGAMLGANYLLSGSCRFVGDTVVLMAELADARSEEVVWAGELTGRFGELLLSESPLTQSLCAKVVNAISASEVRRVNSLPLPTLESFSLQWAGIMLMHRSTRQEFDRARELLELLVERYPRAPQPRAWLALWYVLRVSRGFVENLSEEAARALDHTRRALDASPDYSVALATEGFVHCHMKADLDTADARLDLALESNPNDSFAWIFKCAVHAFRGQGEEGLVSAERAMRLSPLDPMGHYYEAIASTAALAAGQLERAIELASRALQMNRNHLPTLRALAIAQMESGHGDAARATVRRILELDRGITIRQYIERGPRGGEATRLRYAAALGEAGVPK